MSDPNIAEQSADVKSYEADIAALTGAVPEKQEVATTTDVVAKPEESGTFDINTLPPAAKQLLEAEQRKARDLEAKYKQTDRDLRSMKGKLPYLQSKAAQWEKWEAEQKLAQVKPAAAKSPVENTASTLQSLPGWPKLRQIFADDAAPIEEAFSALESHNQKLAERLEQADARMAKMEELLEKDVKPRNATVDELRDYRANEQFEHVTQQVYKARESLATKYPDYQSHIRHELDDNNEIVQTHMSDQFATWIDTKPGRVKELFGPDATQEDVDYGLDLFYRDIRPVETKPNPAQQVQQSRQEQLNRRAVSEVGGNGVARVDASKLSAEEQYALDMKRLTGG